MADQAGGTWHYRVRAANVADSGPWSNAQSTLVNSDIFLPLVVKNYSSPAQWETITALDFEGAFPGSWTLLDDSSSDGGEYYWGKRDCRAASTSHSGWAVGGGSDGSLLPCDSNYPNNVRSWMTYGPFDLTGVAAAELHFDYWLSTEMGTTTDEDDWLCAMYSTDGSNFFGNCTSGDSGGWSAEAFKLDLAIVLGRSQVWVTIYFKSDASNTLPEGVYVDDIVLRKCVSNCTTFASTPASNPNLSMIEVNIEQ